jgi:hypothetical protein
MDGDKLKIPVSLDSKDFYCKDYKPEKLSKKVFSFSLFFTYDNKMNYNKTYIFGLIFTYRLFLYAKKNLNQFIDYKFRVYIDRESFDKNPHKFFYLVYLKKLEIEIMNSVKEELEYIELILCSFLDKKELFIIPVLRFLPVFEGCECHSRDLDFRLSVYDTEVIKIFNESKYPFYFCSHSGFPFLNALLAGCWGGNINNRLKKNIHSNLNNEIFKFFNPEGFFAILKIFSNFFKVKFGLDEIVLKFYIGMLSNVYLENCLTFGSQYINLPSGYIFAYMCINKSKGKEYDNRKLQGIEIVQDFINGEPPLVASFKLTKLTAVHDEENINIYLEQKFHVFFGKIYDPYGSLVDNEKEIINNAIRSLNNKMKGKEHNYTDEQLDCLSKANKVLYDKEINEYSIVGTLTIDDYIEIFNCLDITPYTAVTQNSKIFNVIDREDDFGPYLLHPYLFNNPEKYGLKNDNKRITEYKKKSFTEENLKKNIDDQKEDIKIITVPIKTKIKNKDTTLFDINLIAKHEDFLDCTEYVKSNVTDLRFIYFTKSKIVYFFIFDSKSFINHDGSICAFGTPNLVDDGKLCKFYTIDDLIFIDDNGKIFNPLVGGNYYHKYLKYKTKYLERKKNLKI